MVTDAPPQERPGESPDGPVKRRVVLIAISTASLVAAFVIAGLAVYGRDARGAAAGDCVYDGGAAAIAIAHGWRIQPCALPAPSGATYRVQLRVEGPSGPEVCADQIPSWQDERDKATAFETGSSTAAVVLCVTPLS